MSGQYTFTESRRNNLDIAHRSLAAMGAMTPVPTTTVNECGHVVGLQIARATAKTDLRIIPTTADSALLRPGWRPNPEAWEQYESEKSA